MPLLQISLRGQGRALTRPRRGPLALRLAPFSGPTRPVSALRRLSTVILWCAPKMVTVIGHDR